MDAWKCLKDTVDKLQLEYAIVLTTFNSLQVGWVNVGFIRHRRRVFQNSDDWKEVVAEKMAARKEWWPALHFTRFHASEDAVQRPQLMEVKASLAKILCPGELMSSVYFPSVSSRPFIFLT